MDPITDIGPALDAHARWLAHEPAGVRLDLCRKRLAGIDLSGRNLSEAVMRDVNLTGATLTGTNLSGADLRFASLAGADLTEADLSGAQLDLATLAGANLFGATLRGASLIDTNLDGIGMSWVDHTLVSERLWRAAGDDLELRMLAAFIGRMTNRCWDDHKELSPKHRRWLLRQLASWRRPDVPAPRMLSLPVLSSPAPTPSLPFPPSPVSPSEETP